MSQSSGNHPQPASPWTRCSPGELEQLAGRLQQRTRRRQFLRAVAITGTSAVAASVSAWMGWRTFRDPMPGGLSCDQVHELAAAYGRGELSDAVRRQVREHVSQCPRCTADFRTMGLKL